VNITTATSNGADTKSNIYIKFNGTDGESELLLFSQGVRKGQNVVQNYELESVGDIGALTQVYLELDPPTDQWRYSTFSIIDIYGSEYIFGTKVLNSNIPFLWFDSILFSFFFLFFFFFSLFFLFFIFSFLFYFFIFFFWKSMNLK